MIFSFLKFLNLNFKNHHKKYTLKTCEKPFFKSCSTCSPRLPSPNYYIYDYAIYL